MLELDWKFNVPFVDIPKVLIEQFSDKEFDYADYIQWCPYMDSSPGCWNLVGIQEGEIVVFAYGWWNPLEKELEMKRGSFHPKVMNHKWDLVCRVVKEIERACLILGVKHQYFLTTKSEGYMKRVPELFKVLDFRVMEVI